MGRHRLPRLGAAAVAIVCAATALAFSGAPALAATPRGLVKIMAIGDWNSFDTKTISAVCPRGTSVIGGGGAAYDVNNDLGMIITEAYPDWIFNQFTVVAWEDQVRTAASWRVTAFAICASPLPGLQYVSTPWYTDIDGTWAVCPSGKKLVGMGGRVTGGSGEVALAGIFPGSTSLTRSETWVTEDPDGFSGSYQVRSTSVCADPIPGLEYVVTSKPVLIGAGGLAAKCPTGKKVLSPGVRLANGGAPVWHGEAYFSQLMVSEGVVESIVYGESYLHTMATYTLQAIAICA